MRILREDSQLDKGKKIESEHKNTYDLIKSSFDKRVLISAEDFYESIAKDHIEEIPDYYDRLEKMEKDYENS